MFENHSIQTRGRKFQYLPLEIEILIQNFKYLYHQIKGNQIKGYLIKYRFMKKRYKINKLFLTLRHKCVWNYKNVDIQNTRPGSLIFNYISL